MNAIAGWRPPPDQRIFHEKLNRAPHADLFPVRFGVSPLLVLPIPIYLIERYLLAGGGVSAESGAQTQALFEHATPIHCAELWGASHRDDACGADSGDISVYPGVHFWRTGESKAQTIGVQTRQPQSGPRK